MYKFTRFHVEMALRNKPSNDYRYMKNVHKNIHNQNRIISTSKHVAKEISNDLL